MKDEDFKGPQPLLFGEHFGEKAKARMEEAAALKKIVLLPKPGFSEEPPSVTHWGPPGWQDQTLWPCQQVFKEGVGRKDFTRKVLTRTLDRVNTSCANFKYNCESYSIVNTGGCSKAPLRTLPSTVPCWLEGFPSS